MKDATRQNEVTLFPGQYVYVQDKSSGVIKTHVGPAQVSIQGQDRAVIYNPEEETFSAVEVLAEAICQNITVPEGYYCILHNPASTDAEVKGSAPPLLTGKEVNVQGPSEFALWPGQQARVVKGHVLRLNNYLFVEVCDEEAAQANWDQAVVKRAQPTETGGGESGETPESTEGETVNVAMDLDADAKTLAMGQVHLIRGDQVSFFIPPTGLRVKLQNGKNFIREAATVRDLEFCVLQDESGNKRIARGPAVVFPQPSESFVEGRTAGGNTTRVYKAIELQEEHGIHVRVIADYVSDGTDGTDANGKSIAKGATVAKGDELFIRGSDTAIYYPRQENRVVTYSSGGKQEEVHHATPIPAGNGRYLHDLRTSEVTLIKGPRMLLPDPRREKLVVRALDDHQCAALYPGNRDVVAYNHMLRDAKVASSLAGGGSDSEVQKLGGQTSRSYGGSDEAFFHNADILGSSSAAKGLGRGEIIRRRGAVAPEQIVLDSRFDGVPLIRLATNFAILVVDAAGKRRSEIGPKTILLGYDERVETLDLSTQTPKTDASRIQPAYLQISDNRVSDIVEVVTADHVRMCVKLSYRVDFDLEASEKWFAIRDYVGHLVEYGRRLVKAEVRALPIGEFYPKGEALVRDMLMLVPSTDKKKKGTAPTFANGMVIQDVGVGVEILDEVIRKALTQSQREAVSSTITIANAERKLGEAKTLAAVKTAQIAVADGVAKAEFDIAQTVAERLQQAALTAIEADKTAMTEKQALQTIEEALADMRHTKSLARQKASMDLETARKTALNALDMALLEAKTTAQVNTLGAARDGFTEALLAANSQTVLDSMAQAMSVQQQFFGGDNLQDAAAKLFGGTPLEGLVNKALKQASFATPSNGAPTAHA
jgi:major vault protein